MRKRIPVVILVFLFIVNMSALATLSYVRWIKPKPSAGWIEGASTWNTLQTRMSLSPRQVEQMQGMRRTFQDDITSIREQIWERRMALIDEARKPSPDLGYMDEIIGKISRLQSEIQRRTVRNLLRDKELLSPWQKKKYFSLFEEQMHRQGWQHRRRGRGRGGPRRFENER